MFKKINNLSLKHITIFWIAGAVLLFIVSSFVKAQTQPQILVTWQAESYAPPSYSGKIFPTAGSPITVSFEVVDGGKPVNISQQTIYWYLNNDLIENRRGVQSVTFNAPTIAPSILEVRIELPAYSSDLLLLKTISIPVVRPEAVVEAPYPGGRFSGTQLKMTGAPYFFSAKNINDLVFTWTINGGVAQGAENPREFIINLNPDAPIDSVLNIGLTIINSRFREEAASSFARLVRAQ